MCQIRFYYTLIASKFYIFFVLSFRTRILFSFPQNLKKLRSPLPQPHQHLPPWHQGSQCLSLVNGMSHPNMVVRLCFTRTVTRNSHFCCLKTVSFPYVASHSTLVIACGGEGNPLPKEVTWRINGFEIFYMIILLYRRLRIFLIFHEKWRGKYIIRCFSAKGSPLQTLQLDLYRSEKKIYRNLSFRSIF